MLKKGVVVQDFSRMLFSELRAPRVNGPHLLLHLFEDSRYFVITLPREELPQGPRLSETRLTGLSELPISEMGFFGKSKTEKARNSQTQTWQRWATCPAPTFNPSRNKAIRSPDHTLT